MNCLIAFAALLTLAQQQDEEEYVKRERKKVEPSMKKLEQTPDDPEANEAVGRFLCYVKGDWKGGLPLLEKAKDTELRALAARDKGVDPADSALHAALGDDWWKVASKLKGTESRNVANRAAYWWKVAYEKSGKDARKALTPKLDKWLALLGPTTLKVPPNKVWTDTGLDILDGENVSFAATGKWSLDSNPNKEAWCDWKGYLKFRSPGLPLPDKPVCCMIGKLGENGAPFVLSDFPNLAVPKGGRLFVGVNARPPDDVAGDMSVTIKRSLR